MKTLEQMYSAEIEKQPFNKISIADVMFISAFPNTNIVKKTRELKRAAEDMFEDFFERWKSRIKVSVSMGLESGAQPEIIIRTINPITKDEIMELIRGIDSYLPLDTEEVLALKIGELRSYLQSIMNSVGQIFQEEHEEFMAKQQQEQRDRRILTQKPGIILPGQM